MNGYQPKKCIKPKAPKTESRIGVKANEKYRPCIACGMKALFHRWEEKETLFYQFQNSPCFNQKEYEERIKHINRIGVTPIKCDVHKVKQTFAIVEYASGQIGEVEPTRIIFTDNIIKKYDFTGGGES